MRSASFSFRKASFTTGHGAIMIDSGASAVFGRFCQISSVINGLALAPPAIACSVGCAFGRVGIKAQELFKRADNALYESKENGRGKVSFYTNTNKNKNQ